MLSADPSSFTGARLEELGWEPHGGGGSHPGSGSTAAAMADLGGPWPPLDLGPRVWRDGEGVGDRAEHGGEVGRRRGRRCGGAARRE